MSFKVTYQPSWIHVEYFGHVDAFEVVRQVKDEAFWDKLAEIKTVLYDYSQATNVEMSLDDMKGFAAIAKVQANLIGPINVIALIASPERMEYALEYKAQAESPNWRVKIATTMDEAQSLLKECC